ncbi:hypothetical protein [Actinoplanes utahensis]|uniref:DUF4367 domain-containing protein n=1 Tax=Actinoplanes utahensis TaxID=1869 RepID=A0A0A6UU45_ACTUT|nr:hypothetical protein [Actinoplanes utahensis]KHD77979.1 hypothetical protein MB27_07635 [Actinoplanes utahensis]GIF29962.1 hypothetical protein Aut01nite_29480 [Actinoplanes utahensis]
MPEPDDLIAELRELGARWPVPPAVDQREAVRARLAHPAPRRPRARRWLAVLAAALIVAVAGVAPARAAVAEVVGDLLRIAGVEVRREQPRATLPATPDPLPSAGPAVLAEARRAAAFPVLVPADLGEPESVELADPDPRGHPRVITMRYRGGAVRFDQFDGRLDTVFLKTSPDARPVELGAAVVTAAWMPRPHPVTYVGRDGVERLATARLVGPALVWTTGAVTYRLEGIMTLEEAIAVGRSVR